jgi:hypothetical protein
VKRYRKPFLLAKGRLLRPSELPRKERRVSRSWPVKVSAADRANVARCGSSPGEDWAEPQHCWGQGRSSQGQGPFPTLPLIFLFCI